MIVGEVELYVGDEYEKGVNPVSYASAQSLAGQIATLVMTEVARLLASV